MGKSLSTERVCEALARCVDLASRWLTFCNKNICNLGSEVFAANSDEELADACIAAWGLDRPQGDENHSTWFEVHGADRAMLVDAMSAVRRALTDHRFGNRNVRA